jgi:Outer membrane protein beta-barrel domain
MRIATFVITIVTIFSGGRALAQDRPVHVNIGGGPTFVLGDVADRFSTGWGPAIGVTFDVNPRIGVQFEYAYRYQPLKDDVDVQAGRFDANHTTHQLDFNLVATLTSSDSGPRPYIIAGPGMYYRSVEITEYEGTGVICDPWIYVCGTYPVSSVVGSRGGWDFGVNFGAGVGLRFEGGEFFIESRYHYVWGPDVPTGSNGSGQLPPGVTPDTRKANSSYWPLTFGVRF